MREKSVDRISHRYAITITFKQAFRRFTTVDQCRIGSSVKHMIELQPGVNRLTLVCELTKSDDLHLHGTIDFDLSIVRDCTVYWNDMWRVGNLPRPRINSNEFSLHYVGFTTIKPIEKESGWITYIQKDLTRFHEKTAQKPIWADDFEYFSAEQILSYGNPFYFNAYALAQAKDKLKR